MSLGFRGKTVLVHGLGMSGRATMQALVQDGAKVIIWDDAPTKLQDYAHQSSYTVQDPAASGFDWPQVAAVIKGPGVRWTAPGLVQAQQHNIPIMGDIDLLHRRNPQANFVAITGTNGKSTTTALIAHVLEAAGFPVVMGGNIGKPALQLPELGPDGIYVLELSSFQLETVAELKLDAAVLLNLTPDHLDRYADMAAYRDAKLRIFDRCGPAATKVMGVDQPELAEVAPLYQAQTVAVTASGADYKISSTGQLRHNGKMIADLTYFKNLPGPHNWQNIACALLACKPWVSSEEFFRRVNTFKGLPHRMERVQAEGVVQFINDSKATNPDSVNAALQSFPNIYWIAGGKARAGDVSSCIPHLGQVRAAFLIGEAMETFAKILHPLLPTFKCHTLDVAVWEAYAAAKQEGLSPATILLSPACSSFDQFQSFEHRGDVFATLSRQLVNQQHQQHAGQ